MRGALAIRAGALAASLLVLATAASAQKRNIDHWEGIVLNCGPASTAPIAESICRTWIGEMRKRADAAKVKLVAVPIFADDVALDRRAADEGLELLNNLHVRLEISPPTGELKSRDFTLKLRSRTFGPFASNRRDGDYPVLNFTPGAIANEGSAMALGVAAILADSFFTRMLRTGP